MESTQPDPEGDMAKEGTAVHWVAENSVEHTREPADYTGAQAPNGVIITRDMVEGAKFYLDTVRASLSHFYTERSVECLRIHANCKGTPDTWFYNPDSRVVYLWDLKWGWGIVEPIGNPQFTCYLSGIFDFVAAQGWPSPIHVVATVVQPRPYHPDGPVRMWATTPEDVERYIAWLAGAAAEAFQPEPRLSSGPQCKNCRAVGVCPAARLTTMATLDEIPRSLPDDLRGEDLAREIKVLGEALDILAPRLDALQAQALAMLKAGLQVPGYRMGRGRGSRKWSGGLPAVKTLGQMTGITLTEEKPLSPAQAEAAGVPKEMVSALSTTTQGAPKLVPGDAAEAARKVFNHG